MIPHSAKVLAFNDNVLQIEINENSHTPLRVRAVTHLDFSNTSLGLNGH